MTLGLSVPLYDEEALVEAVVTELIGALEAGDVPFRLALVDNGSRDRTGEIVDRLAEAGQSPRLVIEPKADATWPVVGAASIFAKVNRDAAITALGEVGSGYPSDPVTRAWLSGFLARGEPFPPSVRARWGTIGNLRQQGLFGA